MSDPYLEIPYFRAKSYLAREAAVTALGTGKCKRSRERVVQGKV